MKTKLEKLSNIQTLRGFAAIIVVMAHVIGYSEHYSQPVFLFKPLAFWGVGGVDVFFVISGFVMVYTQTIRPKSAGVFFVNRLFRVAPIYWILTLAMLFIYIFMPQSFIRAEFSLERAVSSFFFVSYLINDELPLLPVGWTLEWEMLFYSLFAVSLLVRDARISFWIPVFSLGALVFIGGANLVALEFVLGMVCGKFFLLEWTRSYARPILIFGLFVFFLTIFYPDPNYRFFIWGIPAFFIVLGAADSTQIKNPLLIFLGDASYSIYLIQVFTIPAFYKFSSIFLHWVNYDLLALVCIILSVWCGCLVYLFVERPLTIAHKRTLGRPPMLQKATSPHES